MSLVNWIFLFGAFAVAGPIVAHLLAKPRYKRIPFTMLRFLRSGQAKSHSRRRLRDLIVLLIRCAIIVLLAMMFAQPILKRGIRPTTGRPVYFLGLDNSMSMVYSDGSKRYLDSLITSACEYVRSAPEDALFNLCAVASGAWTRDMGKAQALAKIKSLDVTVETAKIGDFLADLNSAIRAAGQRSEISVFFASDFTPEVLGEFLNVQEPVAVNSLEHMAIVSHDPIDNVAIVTAQTTGPADDGLAINATLSNYGAKTQNRSLAVKIDGREISRVNVELSPFQRTVCKAQIGRREIEDRLYLPVELNLSPSDGLEDDDTYCIGVFVPQQRTTNILLVEAERDELFLLETAIKTLSDVGSREAYRLQRVLASDVKPSHLTWANVAVFSGLTDELSSMASALEGFAGRGGRAIFFVTGQPDDRATDQLTRNGILPAAPAVLIDERMYLEPLPVDPHARDVDDSAAKALSNYRIDRLAVAACWQCDQTADSSCLWRFQNGMGFIYLQRIGNGLGILVNTSVDGSLGSLFKSSASVALCRYLLGQQHQVREFAFACDERIVLPFVDTESQTVGRGRILVSDCSGRKQLVARAGSALVVADSGGTGWVKTLAKPSVYAGVNLPAGETDMSKPASEDVERAVSRVFSVVGERQLADLGGSDAKRQTPLWKALAWLIVAMLLVESAVTNRLKR